jgi:REP element-mobilizing transposase RayT
LPKQKETEGTIEKEDTQLTKQYDSEFAFRNKRQSTRSPNHNYGWTGTYFVTIRSKQFQPVFEIPELRAIVQKTWEALPSRYPSLIQDEFVIMPDHIHFIIHLEGNVEKPVALGQVVGAFKSIIVVTWLNHIKTTGMECSGLIWQSRFHDRIIRDENELEQTRQYIRNNPLKLKQKNNAQ